MVNERHVNGVLSEDPGAFVVGTGRCGSTLMSRFLNLHSQILSISEFLVTLRPHVFVAEPMDGLGLWRRLSAPHVALGLQLRQRIEPPEFLYPVDAGRRFTRTTGVPPISAIALPHLSDDPDELLDAIETFVCSLPVAPVGQHYHDLFDWLARRLGTSRWVERSGASFSYLPQLTAAFPDSRYVHLHRNGPDTVLSMCKAPGFRMETLRADFLRDTGFDPYSSADQPPGWAAPPALRPFAPATFDRERFLANDFPVERLGALWSRLVRTGVRALARLDPAQVHHLSYEALLNDPIRELTAVGSFLGLSDVDQWAANAAKLVGQPRSSWQQEPAERRSRLLAACRPGERELTRAGLISGFSEECPRDRINR